jgi:two-component system, OmpR family, sensor histidine kinase KdpD
MPSPVRAETLLLDLLAANRQGLMQTAWRISRIGSRLDFGALQSLGGKLRPICMALALVAATTIGLMSIAVEIPVGHAPDVYLVPVLISATTWGLVPALVASALSVAAVDFFFIPPLYSLSIASSEDLINLVLFACVAAVTSKLAARLRHEVTKSRQREADVADLYGFSRRLMTASSASEIYASIEDHLSKTLGARTLVLGASRQKNPDLPEFSQANLPPAIRDEARYLLETRISCPTVVADRQTCHLWMLKRMSGATIDLGIIAIDLGIRSREVVGSIEHNIDLLLDDAIATLERLDISRLISEVNVRTQAEVLREALIGSVSHELRTPLSSILGAATVMLQADPINRDPQLFRLGQMIRDEAERLDSDIQDLLDAARVSTATVHPHLEWVDPVDFVNAALDRKQRLLANHKVEVTLGADLPLVRLDPVLVGQALCQFIENAAKYSPEGSTIGISGRLEQGRIAISVTDEGDGLSEDEVGRIWLRSFRSGRHANSIAGTGLGLWIAQAFVKANGGDVTASSRGLGRGAMVTMSFPASPDTLNELAQDEE